MILPFLAPAAAAHVPIVYTAGPDDDWCGIVNGTIGNDLVFLLPGEYHGPCDVVAEPSNVPGEQTTIQSFDPEDPATFVGSAADYVLHVSGERLILVQLAFEDLPPGVDAVRIGAIEELWIRYDRFRRIPGAAVRSTAGVPALFVTDSEFTEVGAAVTIGCPDGTCATPLFQVDWNLVAGADLAFEVGPGSWGTFHDNVMVDVTTAVRLHGAGPLGEVTLERELYAGAGGPLLDVRGGPATLASSVLLGGAPAIAARGVADLALLGDTVLGDLDLAGATGLRVIDVATDRALPAVAGAEVAGALACADPAACWVDAAARDLYPAPGSPLRHAGVGDPGLATDWCGRYRQDPPTVGAIEVVGSTSFGPLPTGFKTGFDCALEPDPTSTTGPGTTGTTDGGAEPEPGATRRCGCRQDGGSVGGWAALLIGWSRGRGRAREQASQKP